MSQHGCVWAGFLVVWGFTTAGAGEERVPAFNPAVVGEERSEPVTVATDAPGHEALLFRESAEPARGGGVERVAKVPPATVVERPGAGPSKPGSQWVGGYWAWDKTRRDYVWMTGLWEVPPPGKFWVNGYWRHDGRGWYRVAGFWSARADDEPERRADWKKDGPPVAPVEEVEPAPGPNYFYIAGIYTPDAERQELVWKRGFWTRSKPGWDWCPAHWVRQSSGWAFRAGSWQQSTLSGEPFPS